MSVGSSGRLKTTMLIDPEFAQQLETVLPPRGEGRSRSRRAPRSESLFRLGRRPEGGRKLSRLERLLGRLLHVERATLHVLVDASLSMTFAGYTPPQPSAKFDFARRFAAALGYAALCRDVSFEVTTLSPTRGSRRPIVQSREDIPLLLHYLESIRAGGTRNFAWAIRSRVRRAPKETIFVVLSDFRDRNWEWGAPALLMGEARIVLLHLVDRSEVSESGGAGSVPSLEEEVRQRLAEMARQYHLEYLVVPTDTPVEELFLHSLAER